jgi:hypothetical protein
VISVFQRTERVSRARNRNNSECGVDRVRDSSEVFKADRARSDVLDAKR